MESRIPKPADRSVKAAAQSNWEPYLPKNEVANEDSAGDRGNRPGPVRSRAGDISTRSTHAKHRPLSSSPRKRRSSLDFGAKAPSTELPRRRRLDDARPSPSMSPSRRRLSKGSAQWILRVKMELDRLEDRDTQGAAMICLRSMAEEMQDKHVSPFLRCLFQIKEPSKASARASTLDLLSFLATHRSGLLSPFANRIVTFLVHRLQDREETVSIACYKLASVLAFNLLARSHPTMDKCKIVGALDCNGSKRRSLSPRKRLFAEHTIADSSSDKSDGVASSGSTCPGDQVPAVGRSSTNKKLQEEGNGVSSGNHAASEAVKIDSQSSSTRENESALDLILSRLIQQSKQNHNDKSLATVVCCLIFVVRPPIPAGLLKVTVGGEGNSHTLNDGYIDFGLSKNHHTPSATTSMIRYAYYGASSARSASMDGFRAIVRDCCPGVPFNILQVRDGFYLEVAEGGLEKSSGPSNPEQGPEITRAEQRSSNRLTSSKHTPLVESPMSLEKTGAGMDIGKENGDKITWGSSLAESVLNQLEFSTKVPHYWDSAIKDNDLSDDRLGDSKTFDYLTSSVALPRFAQTILSQAQIPNSGSEGGFLFSTAFQAPPQPLSKTKTTSRNNATGRGAATEQNSYNTYHCHPQYTDKLVPYADQLLEFVGNKLKNGGRETRAALGDLMINLMAVSQEGRLNGYSRLHDFLGSTVMPVLENFTNSCLAFGIRRDEWKHRRSALDCLAMSALCFPPIFQNLEKKFFQAIRLAINRGKSDQNAKVREAALRATIALQPLLGLFGDSSLYLKYPQAEDTDFSRVIRPRPNVKTLSPQKSERAQPDFKSWIREQKMKTPGKGELPTAWGIITTEPSACNNGGPGSDEPEDECEGEDPPSGNSVIKPVTDGEEFRAIDARSENAGKVPEAPEIVLANTLSQLPMDDRRRNRDRKVSEDANDIALENDGDGFLGNSRQRKSPSPEDSDNDSDDEMFDFGTGMGDECERAPSDFSDVEESARRKKQLSRDNVKQRYEDSEVVKSPAIEDTRNMSSNAGKSRQQVAGKATLSSVARAQRAARTLTSKRQMDKDSPATVRKRAELSANTPQNGFVSGNRTKEFDAEAAVQSLQSGKSEKNAVEEHCSPDTPFKQTDEVNVHGNPRHYSDAQFDAQIRREIDSLIDACKQGIPPGNLTCGDDESKDGSMSSTNTAGVACFGGDASGSDSFPEDLRRSVDSRNLFRKLKAVSHLLRLRDLGREKGGIDSAKDQLAHDIQYRQISSQIQEKREPSVVETHLYSNDSPKGGEGLKEASPRRSPELVFESQVDDDEGEEDEAFFYDGGDSAVPDIETRQGLEIEDENDGHGDSRRRTSKALIPGSSISGERVRAIYRTVPLLRSRNRFLQTRRSDIDKQEAGFECLRPETSLVLNKEFAPESKCRSLSGPDNKLLELLEAMVKVAGGQEKETRRLPTISCTESQTEHKLWKSALHRLLENQYDLAYATVLREKNPKIFLRLLRCAVPPFAAELSPGVLNSTFSYIAELIKNGRGVETVLMWISAFLSSEGEWAGPAREHPVRTKASDLSDPPKADRGNDEEMPIVSRFVKVYQKQDDKIIITESEFAGAQQHRKPQDILPSIRSLRLSSRRDICQALYELGASPSRHGVFAMRLWHELQLQ